MPEIYEVEVVTGETANATSVPASSLELEVVFENVAVVGQVPVPEVVEVTLPGPVKVYEGGAGVIPAHNDITDRDAEDSHPISAISGLVVELDGKVNDDDPRLSNSRAPTGHAASHASGGSDAVTPASIGAATPAQVTSGDSATLAAAQSHAQGLVNALTAASPATLDTLAEIAAALGEDPNFAATMTTALANRVRFDAAQSLTVPQQGQARTNIGAGTSNFDGAYGSLSGKPTLGTAAAAATGDFATAAQGALADTALQVATAQPINAQTGTTYTLQASDAGKLVTLNNTGAITLNAPGSTFTAGQRVDVLVLNTGMATVVGTSGASGNGTPSLVSRARYSAFTVVWLTATTFVVVGDLA